MARLAKRYQSVIGSVHRFRSYTRDERRRLLWTMGQVIRIDILLRRYGFARARQRLARRQAKLSLYDNVSPNEAARFIATAARYTIGSSNSCLRRSLLLWWLLEQRGIACELKMGLRKRNGTLIGHAWIEIDGDVVNDTERVLDTYRIFPMSGQDWDRPAKATPPASQSLMPFGGDRLD